MLTAGDKKWIKGAIIEGVVDGINQVIIPYSDDQEKRYNKKLDDMKVDLKNDISKLERKLDNVTDNQADKLDNHEKRIGKLEFARL